MQIYLQIAEAKYLRRSQRYEQARGMSNLFGHSRAKVSKTKLKIRISEGKAKFILTLPSESI